MKIHVFMIIFLLSFFISDLNATIISIPSDYPTIQEGLNAANETDTVLVSPGTYYENVSFVSDRVVLLSALKHGAIIDAGGGRSFTHVISLNNHSGVVDGFVLTGSGTGASSGVFTSQKFQLIRNNIITGNSTGISISGGSYAIVMNNEITNNNNGRGTGIWMYLASAHIEGNLIEGHSYEGIHVGSHGPADIVNNTIANNYFNLVCFFSTATIKNNIITSGDYGILFGGEYDPNITEYVAQFLTISYNDVYCVENYFASLGGFPQYIEGPFEPTPGTGEIHIDPQFNDPYNGDFRLEEDSACIDAGDPNSPNVPWGGWRRDMGSFEYDQGFYFDGLNLILKPFPIEIPTFMQQ